MLPMKKIILQVVTVSSLLALPVLAENAQVQTFKTQLSGVRSAELPHATARLVATTEGGAADAVTAAVTINGASAPLVVGAVSKATPGAAGPAAGAAVKLQPKLAGTITKAAVSAAPQEISAVVTASCQASPLSFYSIGMSAVSAAPKSTDPVLAAITKALPTLKPLVQRAQADYAKSGRTASFAMLLKHTENLLSAVSKNLHTTPELLLVQGTEASMTTTLASSAFVLPPPVQSGPSAPGGAPTEIVAADTAEVGPGGRVYSGP